VRRLGYPIIDVELIDEQLYACFEEATSEYSAQVNQFNIRNNLGSLEGQPTGSNYTHQSILGSELNNVITIAEAYGTLANVGGRSDIKKGSILNSAEVENIDNSNNSTIALQNEITLYKDKLEFDYKQLSLGYKAKTLPSVDYDFEQIEIIPHHLAIVEAGRCGDVCEFKDEKGVKPMDLNELLAKLKEMLIDASDADKALVLEAMDGIMPKAETVDVSAMEKKFEDAKNTAISKFMDSKAFKDAMLNYGNERTAIVSKAKNFLESKFDFKDKTNEAITRRPLKLLHCCYCCCCCCSRCF
jgi:hypothetical protein